MIFDSHVHIDLEDAEPFINAYQDKHIGALINAESVFEYEGILPITQNHPSFHISFGIHPWKASTFQLADQSLRIEERVKNLAPYFKQADAVGEIGMDSVWCDVDLKLQREVFIAQLKMAEALGKPIVLHTKGQELEIAQITKDYSVRKLLHWYSCKDYVEQYLAQDCYFTIGPNYKRNSAVGALIEKVPLDRLLVETDGAVAVQWVVDRKVSEEEMPGILLGTVQTIAEVKKTDISDVIKQLEENFICFLTGK